MSKGGADGAPAALNAAQVGALQGAYQMLQRGDAAGALAIVGPLARASGAPEAQHLLALCLRDSGDLPGAAEAFNRALAIAPRNPDILNNYASLLLRQGQPGEAITHYRSALAAAPGRADIWMNISIAQARFGAHREALAAAERAHQLAPEDARVLRQLAAARRETGDLEGAEAALHRALARDPNNGQAWTALGVVRRLIGDPGDALACYAKARALGYATPELADAEASAHLDLGQSDEAMARARALVAAAPDYVAGHVLLAHILWEHGAGGENDPLAAIARAVAAQPAHKALRKAYVDLLLDANRPEEALTHIAVLRAAGDDAALAVSQALALELTGDLAAASALYAATIAKAGALQGLGTTYAQHLIRMNRADEAARHALTDAERDPLDQRAWATLSIAWRLLDDPREHWLCDYERLVMTIEVDPPPGYADRDSFIAALDETLTALHKARHAPINQSLRGGSQTSGGLFGRRDPIIAGAREALRASVRKLIAALPDDPRHPFLSRKAADIRFTGSWSVRLQQAGRHVNHFHPKGWLSSAFYVALPPSVARGDADHSGWIQFGQPPEELRTALAPRRFVQPAPGRLALFPSYMWHGTVPFADAAPRMTIAFDALPKRV